MSDFKPEDIVLVYTDTPTFEDGTVAQIIDRDPNDDSYSIVELKDIAKAKGNVIKLYDMAKWVKPENMTKLSFVKPDKFSVLGFCIGITLGSTIGIGLLYLLLGFL